METYHSDVIEGFIWDLQVTSQRRTNGTSKIRTTETSLGVSFETCLRRRKDALMGRCCYVVLKRFHDVPIRCRGEVPLRRLGDVPPRSRWVFHLRRTCDVAGTYRETSLQRRYNVLLPGGFYLKNVALDFALLVLKLCPIQGVISLPLWIKLTMGQLLLFFLCNFSSFFSYIGGIPVTNHFSLLLNDRYILAIQQIIAHKEHLRYSF